MKIMLATGAREVGTRLNAALQVDAFYVLMTNSSHAGVDRNSLSLLFLKYVGDDTNPDK